MDSGFPIVVVSQPILRARRSFVRTLWTFELLGAEYNKLLLEAVVGKVSRTKLAN